MGYIKKEEEIIKEICSHMMKYLFTYVQENISSVSRMPLENFMPSVISTLTVNVLNKFRETGGIDDDDRIYILDNVAKSLTDAMYGLRNGTLEHGTKIKGSKSSLSVIDLSSENADNPDNVVELKRK